MTDSYREQLVHSLRRVLRPLVRILFRAGVRFDEFIELLRGIYVEIVVADAAAAKKKVSAGRISILSGVPKRDVERLVSSEDWLRIPKPTDGPALAAILHRWHTDSAFQGPYGVPLELPLTGQAGRNFGDLVAGSPIPIDPRSAFEQLLAAGVIARSGETHVKVLSRSYVMPEPLSPEMLEHFGRSMTNLASTLHFNMTPNSKSKRLERSVSLGEGLPEEFFDEFDAYVRERGHAMLSEIDDWLASVARRPIRNPKARVATGISVYHFVAPGDAQLALNEHVIQDETGT
jgi:Family of unknown function (DUF6502)